MSKVFRAKFVEMLRQTIKKEQIELPNEAQVFRQLFTNKMGVFANRLFSLLNNMLEYLCRHSRKIAITNHCILSIEDKQVSFGYKNYRVGGIRKVMHLNEKEFTRRFALHILPGRFMRIRHYEQKKL